MPLDLLPNPLLASLRGPFRAPEDWPHVLAQPSSTAPWLLELVCRLCQGSPGAILLIDPCPALAAAACSGAAAIQTQVFCSTSQPASLPSLPAAVSTAPPAQLAAALNLQPALIIAPRSANLDPLVPHLCPGGVALSLEPGATPQGLQPWAADRIFLSPPSGAIPPAPLPPDAFLSLRQALLADPANLDDARHHLPSEPAAHQRPPGPWPLLPGPALPLPATLPGGAAWPKISIVTPSFNQGRFLEDTILSVANQSYPNVEHIVIDGGSTDETLAVLKRHRHRLAAAISEPDRGQSHAINKGMALATGDLLTWLNSDDMLAPGALAAMAMAFHASHADLVAGVACIFAGGQFTEFHLTSCAPGPLPLDALLDLEGGWNAGQFFYQPEVMFTRALWERAGASVREDLFYSMDYDLWVRFAQANARLHVIGRPICWFRQHPDQKTHAVPKFKAELEQYRQDFLARATTPLPSRPAPPAEPRRRLRVLMVNDVGFRYGAGLAHQRLAETLALAGHEVDSVNLGALGAAPPDGALLHAVAERSPDVVIAGNLHSALPTPQPLAAVAAACPTYAVLHDLWWLTGRCAYNESCDKYRTGCDDSCPTPGEYPALQPTLIAPAWQEKKQTLLSTNAPFLLGNSSWTTSFARETLTAWGHPDPESRASRIKLSFPLNTFAPYDKTLARRLLGLPLDHFLVLLSGELHERRKRTAEAFQALALLNLPNLTVVSLGHARNGETFPVPSVLRPGYISDPTQVALYKAAADLYISPSLDETFGQVFIESAACGTPSIGYRRSGVTEAITPGVTGLLLAEVSPESLASAIAQLHADPALRDSIAAWARLVAENDWSPCSTYHSIFHAWQSTGLTARLGMPPKIGFRPGPAHVPDPEPVHRKPGTRIDFLHCGDEEGPYEEHGLPRFRWAFGPITRLRILAPHGGVHTLLAFYRNLHHGQSLIVRANGSETRPYPLAVTSLRRDRLLCAPLTLAEGPNVVELQFGAWNQGAHDPRPLAAVITEVLCLPDP